MRASLRSASAPSPEPDQPCARATSATAAAGSVAAASSPYVAAAQRSPRRLVGDRDTRGGDEILTEWIALHPLERHAEEVHCEVGDGRRVAVGAHRRAGGDRLQVVLRCYAVQKPAQEHRQLRALGSVVDVRLVDDDETPAPARLAVEEVHVLRAQEQVSSIA